MDYQSEKLARQLDKYTMKNEQVCFENKINQNSLSLNYFPYSLIII